MAATISIARRSALFVGLLLASCDPVRPGDYEGDFPPPQTLDLTRVPSLPAMVGAEVAGYYLQSARDWTNGIGASDVFRITDRKRVAAAVWPALARGLSAAAYGDRIFTPGVAFGTVWLWSIDASNVPIAVGANHLFVAADRDMDTQPIGPGGPTLAVRRGFQIFHRTCSPENLNQFEAVPLDAAIEMVPASAGQPPDAAYLGACGLKLTPPELGQRVPGDPQGTGIRGPMQSMAWSPSADKLYFLAGPPPGQYSSRANTVGSLDVTSFEVSTLLSDGDYEGPLQVATNGTSLLFIQMFSSQSGVLARMSLEPGSAILGMVPAQGPTVLLSPDGATLAYRGPLYDSRHRPQGEGIILLDITTGSQRALTQDAWPLAWAPDGKALLVLLPNRTPWSTQMNGQLLPTDDSSVGTTVEGLPATLSWDGSQCVPYIGNYFWTASGPKIVTQDCRGLLVQDLVTQQITELVEPSRVAVFEAPLQVVAATDQVLAWAIQCFGIGETSCNAELRRLSLATGARDVVATANHTLVFAVSRDGKTLALAANTDSEPGAVKTDIYLKPLTP